MTVSLLSIYYYTRIYQLFPIMKSPFPHQVDATVNTLGIVVFNIVLYRFSLRA